LLGLFLEQRVGCIAFSPLALAGIAARRGQSLAQMALAWVLRQPAITSVVIGVS
jgi:aryl-alcohol dehydrogenase-like predicted oxidoreductase